MSLNCIVIFCYLLRTRIFKFLITDIIYLLKMLLNWGFFSAETWNCLTFCWLLCSPHTTSTRFTRRSSSQTLRQLLLQSWRKARGFSAPCCSQLSETNICTRFKVSYLVPSWFYKLIKISFKMRKQNILPYFVLNQDNTRWKSIKWCTSSYWISFCVILY